MKLLRWLPLLGLLLLGLVPLSGGGAAQRETEPSTPLVYSGGDGPGKGKHVVLVAGDEEYRSEEALPQLGRILAKYHGFKCTVLFSLNGKGEIDPDASNIPGLEALASADLMVLFLRFRNLPDGQMKHIVDYVEAGKPIMGLRTATHAFNTDARSKYADWNWTSRRWPGGFGKQVLGETWVAHHGDHGRESTRGVIAPKMHDHPVVRGVKDGDVWGPTDVYTVKLPLPGDSQALVMGQVLGGMKPTDRPVAGKKNDPMMPIAWVKSYSPARGKRARVFTSTMCSSQDLESAGLRRLLVNAAYWCVGLDAKIPERARVDLVGAFKPSPFRGGGFKKHVKPSDLAIR